MCTRSNLFKFASSNLLGLWQNTLIDRHGKMITLLGYLLSLDWKSVSSELCLKTCRVALQIANFIVYMVP